MAIQFEAKKGAKKPAAKRSTTAKKKPGAKSSTASGTRKKPAAKTAVKAKKPAPKRTAAKTTPKTGTHKGGMPPKLTDIKKVIEVLRASGGLKTVAAQRLNVSRTTLYKFIDDHPEVDEALEEIGDEIGDIAESQIIKAIREGDLPTVRWFAEMKMKNRGYVRRVENTGKDGGPVETRQAADLSGYTDEELEQMLAIEEARERRKAENRSG